MREGGRYVEVGGGWVVCENFPSCDGGVLDELYRGGMGRGVCLHVFLLYPFRFLVRLHELPFFYRNSSSHVEACDNSPNTTARVGNRAVPVHSPSAPSLSHPRPILHIIQITHKHKHTRPNPRLCTLELLAQKLILPFLWHVIVFYQTYRRNMPEEGEEKKQGGDENQCVECDECLEKSAARIAGLGRRERCC